MKFEQMYGAIFNSCATKITLAGRPGIGKTRIAMQIAAKYALESGKRVLYVVGDEFKYYYGDKRKSRINEFPEKIRDKIVLWKEVYKYRTEFYLIYKVRDFCEENKDIGLVIFDDSTVFNMDDGFVACCRQGSDVKVILLAHVNRKSEKRKKCIPKLKDISKPLTENSNMVFTIYRENYYCFETDINASDEDEFIKLK